MEVVNKWREHTSFIQVHLLSFSGYELNVIVTLTVIDSLKESGYRHDELISPNVCDVVLSDKYEWGTYYLGIC